MKKIVLLCLVCALAYLFVFTGINWGVPSSSKIALMMDEQINNEIFYDSMVKARDVVYRDTKSHLFASPQQRDDEFKAKDRIAIDYKKDGVTFYYSNYMRHFFLCSHDPDENGVFNALYNLKPSKYEFNPHCFYYGGGYIYSLAAAYKIMSWVKLVKLVPDMRYYFHNVDDMGDLYTAGRVFGAVIGILGIIMLVLFEYKISGGVFWPFVLAVLCFTSPIVIVVSKLLKPHFYLLPLSMGCFLASYRFFITKNTRYLFGALFLCGLCVGTTVNTGLLVMLPVLVYLHVRLEARTPLASVAKDVALGAMLMGLGAVVLNPYWILSPQEVLHEFKWLSTSAHTQSGPAGLYYFFRYAMGIFPSILFVAAAGAGIYFRRKAGAFNLILLQFLLLILAFIFAKLATRPADMRWAIFILPLSFYYLVEIFRLKEGRQFWIRAIVVACLAGSVIDAFRFRSYVTNDSKDITSTRVQAGEWINENIGYVSIGHLYDIIPWTFPPIKFTAHKIVVYGDIEKLFTDSEKPQYFVLSDGERDSLTKEQERRLYEIYRDEKDFHNSREIMPMSTRLLSANIRICVLKRI